MSLLLALAAAATVAADLPPARPASASARATIRIVSATAVRFAEVERSAPERLRETRVRASDGSLQTARVLEFQ